jgi:hypothetical protein
MHSSLLGKCKVRLIHVVYAALASKISIYLTEKFKSRSRRE